MTFGAGYDDDESRSSLSKKRKTLRRLNKEMKLSEHRHAAEVNQNETMTSLISALVTLLKKSDEASQSVDDKCIQ